MYRPANKFVISCTALAALLIPLVSAATASSPRAEVSARVVNFADLDLTNSKAVATLYRRIKLAAGKVCESSDPASLQMLLYARSCTRQAIEQAVRDVNWSGLTTLHLATTSQTDFQ